MGISDFSRHLLEHLPNLGMAISDGFDIDSREEGMLIDNFKQTNIAGNRNDTCSCLVVQITHLRGDVLGQDYKEKHKLDLKQISNSPC